MPRPLVAKTHRLEAERAAEHYLYEVCGCQPEQIIRAVRTRYQKIDLWAADVMGRRKDGHCYFAQATAGGSEAVRTRRRKLEQISWNPYDHVFVLQLVERQDIVNMRRKSFFFRVHRYLHGLDYYKEGKLSEWIVDDDACSVPREWFKKLRVEKEG